MFLIGTADSPPRLLKTSLARFGQVMELFKKKDPNKASDLLNQKQFIHVEFMVGACHTAIAMERVLKSLRRIGRHMISTFVKIINLRLLMVTDHTVAK